MPFLAWTLNLAAAPAAAAPPTLCPPGELLLLRSRGRAVRRPAAAGTVLAAPPLLLLLRSRGRVARPPLGDFWQAFKAWFDSDPAVRAAFPGSVVAARAASAQAYPYGRLWDAEYQDPTSPEDAEAAFTFSAYGASDSPPYGDEAAVAAGQVLVARLTAGPSRPPLEFAYAGRPWREAGTLWEPPASLKVVAVAAGGVKVWRYDVAFRSFLTLDE